MKVEGIRLDALASYESPQRPLVEARALAGGLPDLQLGEQLKASVLQVTANSALIDLKGTQVLMDALPGLRPGVEVLVKVAGLSPQLLLEFALTPPAQQPALEVGQEIIAQIKAQLPGGRLLIDVQDTLLEAEAPPGLSVGAELSARVEQLRPQIVLHILDPGDSLDAEATRILRANLPHQVSAGDSLHVLQQELAQLVDLPAEEAPPVSVAKLQTFIKDLWPDDTPPTAEQLTTFVRDGGLHYEAKLLRLAAAPPQVLAHAAETDLKGLLLQTLQEVETVAGQAQVANPLPAAAGTPPVALHLDLHLAEKKARPALFEEGGQGEQAGATVLAGHAERQSLAASIVNHLDHIETQQAVNLLAQAHGEPYQLQIPFFTGQGLSTALLSIEPKGGRKQETGKGRSGEKGTGYNVLFLLDLEGFGQTRIDAHLTAKTLWVAFYVDQSSAVTLLQSELPAFRETLQSLGYEDVLLVAKPLGQLAPEKRQKFETLAVGASPSVHLIDVKA